MPEDFQIPDEKILRKLQDLVENCSLQGVSRKDLRCWLEQYFRVPLFHRRNLIKGAVDEYLDNVKRDIGVDGLLKISHTLPTLDQFESLDLRKLLGWKHRYGMGLGFRNLKNSCFMNAVLQSLLYSSPLFNYLLQESRKEDSSRRKSNEFDPLQELQKLSHDIYSNQRKQVSPTQIYHHLSSISSKLQPGRQEDAHEFLEYFLDSLHSTAMKQWKSQCGRGEKGMPRRSTLGSSFVYSIFGGCVRSQVQCQSCRHISNSYQTCTTLSLEVTERVEGALEKYTTTEKLTRDNQYYCSKCKRRVDAKKRLTIFSSPPVLVLHVKRFSSEYARLGYTKKIHDHIDFPERLPLSRYMSDPSHCSPEYQLHAVVVHTGYSGNNGHYVCYVRDSNTQWHHVDDHFVMPVPAKKVLQQQAYILFYTLRSAQFLPATRPISKHFNINSILAKHRKSSHDKQHKQMRSSTRREKALKQASAARSTRASESGSQRPSTVRSLRSSQRYDFPRPRSKSTQSMDSSGRQGRAITDIAGARVGSDWEMANVSSLESAPWSTSGFSGNANVRSLRSSASNAGRTRSTGRRRHQRGNENRWSGSVASTRSNDWLLSNDGLKG